MDREDYLSSYGPPYGDDEKVLESINNNDDLKKNENNNKYIQNPLSNSVETFQSTLFRKNPQEKPKFPREIPVKNSFPPDPDVEFIHQWKKNKPSGGVKPYFYEKPQKFRSKPLPKRELPKFVSQIHHDGEDPVVQVPVIEEKDFKRQANEYPPPPPPPDVAGNSNVEYEFKDLSETLPFSPPRQENIEVVSGDDDFSTFERPFGFSKPKRELTKDSHHPHHSHPHPHENEVNHDSHQHPHSHPHESQENHYHGEFVHQNNNHFPPNHSPKFDFIPDDFDSNNAQLHQNKPDLKQVNPSNELISFEPDSESVGYQQIQIHDSDTFIEFPKHEVKEDDNNQVVLTSYGGNVNGNNENHQTFESSFGTTLTNANNVNQDEFEYIETKDVVPSYPNQLTFGGNLNKDHNKSIFGTTFGDNGNGNQNKNKGRTKKETESKSYSYFETSFGNHGKNVEGSVKTAPEIQLFKTLNVNDEADNTKSIFGTSFNSVGGGGAGNGNPNKERTKKETGGGDNKSYSYFGTSFGSNHDNENEAAKDINVSTKTTTSSIWSTTFNQPADQPAKTNIKERNIPKFKPTKLTKPYISVKPREDHFHWKKNSQQPSSSYSYNNLLNEEEYFPPTTSKLTSPERQTTKLDSSSSFATFHNDLTDFKNNASPVFREIPEPLPNPLSQQQKHRRHHQTSSLFNHEVNQVNHFRSTTLSPSVSPFFEHFFSNLFYHLRGD